MGRRSPEPGVRPAGQLPTTRVRSGSGQQNPVDHVDHAIGRRDVGLRHVGLFDLDAIASIDVDIGGVPGGLAQALTGQIGDLRGGNQRVERTCGNGGSGAGCSDEIGQCQTETAASNVSRPISSARPRSFSAPRSSTRN